MLLILKMQMLLQYLIHIDLIHKNILTNDNLSILSLNILNERVNQKPIQIPTKNAAPMANGIYLAPSIPRLTRYPYKYASKGNDGKNGMTIIHLGINIKKCTNELFVSAFNILFKTIEYSVTGNESNEHRYATNFNKYLIKIKINGVSILKFSLPHYTVCVC